MGCWRCGRSAYNIVGCSVPGCALNAVERKQKELLDLQLKNARLENERLMRSDAASVTHKEKP